MRVMILDPIVVTRATTRVGEVAGSSLDYTHLAFGIQEVIGRGWTLSIWVLMRKRGGDRRMGISCVRKPSLVSEMRFQALTPDILLS